MASPRTADILGRLTALSDPTRRSIVRRLTTGPATVNELARPFSISQQAVSKHLAYLEAAHLVERRWRGRQNYCALKADTIREVADWAAGYRQLWEKSFQRLDALLEDLKQANKTGHQHSQRSKRKTKQ